MRMNLLKPHSKKATALRQMRQALGSDSLVGVFIDGDGDPIPFFNCTLGTDRGNLMRVAAMCLLDAADHFPTTAKEQDHVTNSSAD